MFDSLAFFLASGTLYLALPVMVWALLHRRYHPLHVGLWCASGMLFAAGLILYGLRAQISELLSVYVANGAIFLAAALQVMVLRLEAQRPSRGLVLVVAALVATALLAGVDAWLGAQLRQATANLVLGLFALLQSLTAWQLTRMRRSRSARLMALLYGLMGVALLMRSALRAAGLASGPVFLPDALFILTVLLSLGAALAANVGFLGLALDQARALELQQRAALQALHDHQVAMETAARAREVVAHERARTARVLAHEVRQPLHNAAVALQSAAGTLAHSRDPSEAARAIEQAQGVIRRVSATLDNTVAAAALLGGEGRLSTVDADLQVLIDLCLGDLPPEARPRVQVDYRADARSARLEPTLVRLALRNLLTNATLYAPPATPVMLRVLDSDQPLALVIEVADQGPGIPAELRERIFDEGVRGEQNTVPGYGLGLHVVKRVARLHGGSIAWRPNEPQGSVFRLTLPQGDPG
jgi:signal transduction histidine kinase